MPRSPIGVIVPAVAAVLAGAAPGVGAGIPAVPASVGPAYVADSLGLTRLGLAIRDEGVVPRAVSEPKVAGVVADDSPGRFSVGPYLLRQLPDGSVLLVGRYGSTFRGPDLSHLAFQGVRDDLSGRFGLRSWWLTSDGGVVGDSGAYEGYLLGFDRALAQRWATPHTDTGPGGPVAPFAVAPGDVLYALGGTPSVMDATTGKVTAAVVGLPAGETPLSVVGAPDGSARVLTAVTDTGGAFLTVRLTLSRIGKDGHVEWSTPVALREGNLGVQPSTLSVGPDGTTYLGTATTNGISYWDGHLVAVGPGGTIGWQVPTGGMPSRPAVDGTGDIWVATSLGRVVAVTPTGTLAFARQLTGKVNGPRVAAIGDGVIATVGLVTVRLVARAAPQASSRPRVTVRPSLALQQRPLRCVVATGGRPTTCLYRIARTPSLRVTSPADGLATVRIAPATPILVADASGRKRPLRPAPDVVPVLAGVNVMPLGVLNRALLSLWMNLAVHTLMRLPRTRDLRTWFFFDEVHALHRLPAIEDGLQTARGFGGAFVLGIHSFAKLAETYGKEGAQNLASLARTKLVLAAADRDTAEHCSDYIGHREVRMMDEAYSYGYSNIRDAATITPRSEVQPLVLPDDIMKLPSLRGFLVFPEGFDAARIKLTYKDYPKVAEGYVLRAHVEPIEFARDADDDAEGEAGGRENKDELELAPAPAIDDEPAKPQPAPRQEELNFAVTQTEATPAPQSSLGRSMIASAEIVKSAATTRARETETAPKTSRSAGPTVPAQRSTRAARELAEAIDRDVSAEREKEASRQPEIDAPTPDDGMEM